MSMFIEVFLVLCIMAQPQFCGRIQTYTGPGIANANHTITILSRINGAGNCHTFGVYKIEPQYEQVQAYCERPFPATPGEKEFVSNDVALCMVLYDAVQRVCEVEYQAVHHDISSRNFSCDTMIKTVPETTINDTKFWVTFLKAKFRNISNCKQACEQENVINPVCEYILRANLITEEAQVSATTNVGISPTENRVPEATSQDHGKDYNTFTDKEKISDKKAVQPPPVDLERLIPSDGSQKTENSLHTTTVTNKSSVQKGDHVTVNGNSVQSSSGNIRMQTTSNTVHDKGKKETQTANTNKQNVDSNKQNDSNADSNKQNYSNANSNKQNDSNTDSNKLNYSNANSNKQNVSNAKSNKQNVSNAKSNKQNDYNANSTNSSVQNKEARTNNGNSRPAEVIAPSATPSISEYTEHPQEAKKHDDNTGKDISSGSKSNTALQPENKNSAGIYEDPEIQNQSGDNEDSIMPTEENYNSHIDDVPNGDENQIDRTSMDQPEQREEVLKEPEIDQEEAETGNTSHFNQLVDADESHFYAYFMTMVVICIIGYLVFHNKQKILALALEGRSRRGTRRRPNTSAYRKLDSNLEEAVTSTCSKSVTHVIY